MKKHFPCRGTAAVHCITLYESVGNPGHSSRSLRNRIPFAMQIVVRSGHLASSVETGTPGCVCGPGPPWRGPWAPRGAPSRRRLPRQPDSLVSGPLALLALAKNMASASSSCFSRSRRILPPSSSLWTRNRVGSCACGWLRPATDLVFVLVGGYFPTSTSQ